MKSKNHRILIAFALSVLILLPAVYAGNGDGASAFINYWNAGATRAEQNEEVFTSDFIARRTPAGLARIMNMIYGDNGDIAIHTIHSSSNERIHFLASTEKGNWLDIDLSLSAGQKVDGMNIGFTDAPPAQSDKGMTHSDHYDKFETASGKATGYFVPRGGNELISNQQDLGRIGSPAGGGYASANDLLRFATALYDDSLIDAEHREQMTSKKTPGAGGGYAYLYQDGRVNNRRYVGHNGGAPGINAEFMVFPDSGYTIIVLSNLGHAASPVADQVRQWVGYASD